MMVKEKKASEGKKAPKGVQIVEFVRNESPYVVGDVAGIDDKTADAYIKSGVAKIHK